MEDYPPVIVLIVTYRRLKLALETIRSVKKSLGYPNIGFHIADDGSGKEYVQRLIDEIGPEYSVTATDGGRRGVGTNMNDGIEVCLKRADLWLHLEDDWVLPETLDLAPAVQLLSEDPSIGMVRLGRLSTGPEGKIITGANKLWWNLKIGSDPYIFTGNPSLRHRRFHDAYGIYQEGLKPGETELSYATQVGKKVGPGIVWPAWLTPDRTWQHIGDHQSFKWWMETAGLSAEEAADKFSEGS